MSAAAGVERLQRPVHDCGLVRPEHRASGAIALPDFDSLRKLKPNVAFNMPESLFNLLETDLKGLTDGNKPPPGPSLGIDWICGFSIPVITFCAFLVLNIFLKLFDIIFQWMLFIKICIPLPVPRKR